MRLYSMRGPEQLGRGTARLDIAIRGSTIRKDLGVYEGGRKNLYLVDS